MRFACITSKKRKKSKLFSPLPQRGELSPIFAYFSVLVGKFKYKLTYSPLWGWGLNSYKKSKLFLIHPQNRQMVAIGLVIIDVVGKAF